MRGQAPVGCRQVVQYVRKLFLAVSALVTLILLSCCVVSVFHPIVVQVSDQSGGNLDRGIIHAVHMGYLAADAGSQPVTWPVPGFHFTRSPVSNVAGAAAFHLWAGTDRQMTVSPPDSQGATRFGLYYVEINGWLVAGLAAVYPCAALVRGPWRRHRRRRRGQCVRCGYDLTGNLSGVCPECGGLAEAP